jgi:hypothetical protein
VKRPEFRQTEIIEMTGNNRTIVIWVHSILQPSPSSAGSEGPNARHGKLEDEPKRGLGSERVAYWNYRKHQRPAIIDALTTHEIDLPRTRKIARKYSVP